MSMGFFQAPTSPLPSVVVAQDGSGDYNGTTEECIQDAIDALTPYKHWIHVKGGTYTIATNLDQNELYGVILTGEGESTRFILEDDTQLIDAVCGGWVLKDFYLGNSGATDTDLGLITDTSGGGEYRSMVLENIVITVVDCVGILVVKGLDGMIKNCMVTATLGRYGIRFAGGVTQYQSNVLTTNNGVYGGSVAGIALEGLKNCTYNRITDNYVNGAGVGIKEDAAADYNMFSGNTTEICTVGYDIKGVHSITGVNL